MIIQPTHTTLDLYKTCHLPTPPINKKMHPAHTTSKRAHIAKHAVRMMWLPGCNRFSRVLRRGVRRGGCIGKGSKGRG